MKAKIEFQSLEIEHCKQDRNITHHWQYKIQTPLTRNKLSKNVLERELRHGHRHGRSMMDLDMMDLDITKDDGSGRAPEVAPKGLQQNDKKTFKENRKTRYQIQLTV